MSLPENPIDSDSDGDIEDIEDIRIDSVKSVSTEIRVDSEVKSVGTAAALRGAGVGSQGVINDKENATENITTVKNTVDTTKDEDIRDLKNLTDLTDSLNDNALTVLNSERAIMAFTSPAADYFQNREFQGLLPIAPEGQVTAVQPGQYGIAATYKKYEKT